MKYKFFLIVVPEREREKDRRERKKEGAGERALLRDLAHLSS